MTDYNLKRSIVLVGLMGAGKSSVGKKLSDEIGVSFADSDDEIELASGMSVSEIFEKFGEQYFRAGEERVMKRLLLDHPQIIASGGGAFMSKRIRDLVKLSAVSVWIKADFNTLWERVRAKGGRPLLQVTSPEKALKNLIKERSLIYDEADITVQSKRYVTHSAMVLKLIKLLSRFGELEQANEKSL